MAFFDSAIERLLNNVSRVIPVFNKVRLATATVSNSEYLSLIGLSYIAEIDVTLAAGTAQWYRFVAPADRDVQILKRTLTPNAIGAEYNLYTAASGIPADGSTVIANRVNPLTGYTSTSSIHLLGSAPTTPGAYTTPLFVGTGAGNGANSVTGSTNSTDTGLVTYGRGAGFVARIYNSSAVSNRIVFRLEFAEVDPAIMP